MRRFYAKLFSLTVFFTASLSAQNYPAAPSKGYPPPPPSTRKPPVRGSLKAALPMRWEEKYASS